MKKIVAFLMFILFVYSGANARILTVSNMAGQPAQYSTLLDAVSAARPYDTLYIHGSALSYGDIIFHLPLVLIGTGHNPQKVSPLTCTLGIVDLNGIGTTQLIGLTIGAVNVSSPSPTDTLRIKRCKLLNRTIFGSIVQNGNGTLIIEGNVFDTLPGYIAISYSSPSQIIIQNNIIDGQIQCSNPSVMSPAMIRNNVFIGAHEAFVSLRNAVVINNIFHTAVPFGFLGAHESVMHHNISHNNAFGFLPPPFDDPAMVNLIVDPLFINVPNGDTFNYAYDYRLRSDSPGRLMGTDGKDVGLYGGDQFIFTMTGEPGISQIVDFTMQSSTVRPGGVLEVYISTRSIH